MKAVNGLFGVDEHMSPTPKTGAEMVERIEEMEGMERIGVLGNELKKKDSGK